MNSEKKSETPRTGALEAQLMLDAEQMLKERKSISAITKHVSTTLLNKVSTLERELNEVKNSPHQLELARQILANDQLQSEFNRLRADLKNAQDAIASARDAALVEAAEIACKRSTGRSGPTSRPMLVAREIYHAILALRTQPSKERTEK